MVHGHIPSYQVVYRAAANAITAAMAATSDPDATEAEPGIGADDGVGDLVGEKPVPVGEFTLDPLEDDGVDEPLPPEPPVIDVLAGGIEPPELEGLPVEGLELPELEAVPVEEVPEPDPELPAEVLDAGRVAEDE